MTERFFPNISIEQENEILNKIVESSYTIQMQCEEDKFQYLSIFKNINYSLLYNIYVNDFKSISPADFSKINDDLNYLGDEQRLYEFLAYIKHNYKTFNSPNKDVESMYNGIVTDIKIFNKYELNHDIIFYIVNDCVNMLKTYELNKKSIVSSIFYSCVNNSTSCLKHLSEKYIISKNDKNNIILSSIHNLDICTVKILENANFNFDHFLTCACENGKLDIVKHLVSKGVNVNEEDTVSLKYACEYGHIQIVDFLIKNNANINDSLGIVVACEKGFIDIVKLLIDNGAKIEECLKYACKSGNLNLVKYLIEQKEVDVNEDNTLSLCYACKYNYIEIVKYLIEKNANIDDSYAMINACLHGYDDIVQLLIDNGGDVNIEFFNEWYEEIYYPITYAVENNHLSTVELLIKHNANIHIDDESSLSIACQKGYVEIVKLLIKNGANIHVNDDVLSVFLEKFELSVIELLNENDASRL